MVDSEELVIVTEGTPTFYHEIGLWVLYDFLFIAGSPAIQDSLADLHIKGQPIHLVIPDDVTVKQANKLTLRWSAGCPSDRFQVIRVE